MPIVGVGYRPELAGWIESRPPEIECVEVTADFFFNTSNLARLARLRRSFPLVVHGLSLSLGKPGPLDPGPLERFARVVEAADPLWVSEHVGFSRTDEVDLGHFNPVRPDDEMLAVLADHAHQVMEHCGRLLVLENIASHLRIRGTLSETEFLNRLCERSGCGLLIDVTNLYVNSRNHGFDPRSWLRDIDPERIVQLHVVGYSYRGGRWHDRHHEAIQGDLWSLIDDVLAYAPARAAIIERDGNFPAPAELAAELSVLKAAGTPARETG